MDIASMSDIHQESQLQELSVRELKIILQANCINYRGCVEKRELLEKVVQLWRARQEEKGKHEASLVPSPARIACSICTCLVRILQAIRAGKECSVMVRD